MAEDVLKEATDESLWVLTRLKDSIYAVEGICVEAILEQKDEIIQMPDSDNVRIGMIMLRGGFIPVVDLRVLMGMHSYDEDLNAFTDMLEQRKQDHVKWVDELKRCFDTGDEFKLATDPHKCAFGRWYDNYHTNDSTVAFQLQKIEEPHRKLHESAVEAFECLQRKAVSGEDIDCTGEAVHNAENVYMPAVLKLLDESKQVFRESYRKMMVAVSYNGASCALLVDEVLSAEPLMNMKESRTVGGEAISNPLVTHIAQRRNDDSQILVLNLERLFESAGQE